MAIGFDIGGSLGVVVPDKGQSRDNEPKVFIAEFGDGYEQRTPQGINNISQSIAVGFSSRPKDEIDDIVAYLQTLGENPSIEIIVATEVE